MKKALAATFLLLLCLGLGGCGLTQQPEHQAYVITLGIDRAQNGQVEVWVQVPSIGGGGSSEDSGSGGSKYEMFSAQGADLSDALDLLAATLPSRLQLTLTKSVVVAEAVARSQDFKHILDDLVLSYHIYDSAAVIVTRGTARDFLAAQKPSIGIRLSTSVMAALEQFRQSGYIPYNTLYDLFSANHSIYSDPVLILADTGPEDTQGQDGQGQAPASAGEPPSLDGQTARNGGGTGEDGPVSTAQDAYPGTLPRTGPNLNQYMGCALMRDGQMVGTLDGVSSRWLCVLRGEVDSVSYLAQCQALELRAQGAPQAHLELGEQSLEIQIELALRAYPPRRNIDLEQVRRRVTQDITRLFAQCQQAGVEPLNLAQRAALGFPTVDSFTAYAFREKFCQAAVDVSVTVELGQE